ncbi:helix-turn-helix domain-containing protein [Paraburkholderia tropica]|uniref:winged helix-turn-helix transcriptional regulator n=1 Tax=Paraburkholderia TaxID=1822464 RepID=UPI0032B4CD93
MSAADGILPPFGTDLRQPCIVRDVVDLAGDRWSVLVLAHLANSPLRFNTLQRCIGGISKQVLSRTLKRLEEDGFVSRKIYEVTPPQVEYALTGLGKSFLEPMRVLFAWAESHTDGIASSRQRFAAMRSPR